MAATKKVTKKHNSKKQSRQSRYADKKTTSLVVAFVVLSLVFASLAFLYYT